MKKTVAILLSVLMLVSFCLPAGALQLETVETTEETSTVTPETSAEEASEVTLSQAGWFAPGLNAANGTDAVETFTSWTGDNANYVSSTNFNTRVLGTAPTTISEAGNNCIVFTRNASTSSESYPQIVLMCRMEKGRTYSLAYRMYYDGIAQGKTNDICLWTMTESGAVVESLGESLAAASKANEWYSYSNTA
ncbi:MAG: hypothetical protein ACI4RV_09900, partial [Eubacteriales bacterium]